MKKRLAILMAACLLGLSLAACGGGGSGSGDNTPKEITGETVDTGVFSAFLPTGWTNVPQKDMWSEDNAIDPDVLLFVKGQATETDYTSKPYVMINHYEPTNYFISTKSFYDDVKDLEGVTFQGKELEEAFTALYDGIGNDYGYTILDYVGEDAQWHITILSELDGKSTGLSLDSAEVQKILDSIVLD